MKVYYDRLDVLVQLGIKIAKEEDDLGTCIVVRVFDIDSGSLHLKNKIVVPTNTNGSQFEK